MTEGVSGFAADALSYVPEPDSDGKRDAAWLRWLKFTALVLVPAVVFGLGFMLEDYVFAQNSHSYHERQQAERLVQHDTVYAMKWRFGIGAALGGGLGLIYVVRCILRKVDP